MHYTAFEPLPTASTTDEHGTDIGLLDQLLGEDAYAACTTPVVRAITVSSLNGSSTVDGVSGGLGNELDFQLLLHVRAWADVILVGSATAVAENYGAVELSDLQISSRLERDQSPLPRLAVVSRSLPFEPNSPIFADSQNPPLLVVPESSRAAAEELSSEGNIVITDTSNPSAIVAALQQRGLNKIALEGGPRVLQRFLATNCVDVLHLTVDPTVTYPNQHPAFAVGESDAGDSQDFIRTRFTLEHGVVTDDSVMFTRYRRQTSA